MSDSSTSRRDKTSAILSASMAEKLRQSRNSADQQRSGPPAQHRELTPGPTRKSFDSLSEYRKIETQKRIAGLANIENPFYRAHEGSAGAQTQINGQTVSNFASYDYLGTNTHPKVRDRVTDALACYGVSASASRLVAGERPLHSELEAAIARNYSSDAAVCFVSGYLTNVTTISCLLGPQDLIVHDEYIHNSALAGAQLSGAQRRFFKHNDVLDLENILESVTGSYRRTLVIAEGIYSMDGDIVDLPGLLRLRERFGFWIMIDEAHALGVLGRNGRGTFEHFDIDPGEIDIWMGTLSKTTSSCGGYIAGSKALIEILKAEANGYVYSVGLAPPLAAAALTSLEILAAEPERVHLLQRNGKRFIELAKTHGLDTGTSAGYSVVPILVGDSLRAVELSNRLLKRGVNALPIIHPAVPERLARIRFFLTSTHTEDQIKKAVDDTAQLLEELAAQGVGAAQLDFAELQQLLASQ